MTNNEFLNLISDKAKGLINNYPCKTNKTDIKVFLDERSYVETNIKNMYVIHVNKNNSLENMEYDLLHEFFHCVQIDEGYPSVYQKDIKYKDLATNISSMVLDLDVNNRLKEVGYLIKRDNISTGINDIKKLIMISKKDQSVYNEMREMCQYNYFCLLIAYYRLTHNDQNEISQSIKVIKENAYDFYKTQELIYNTVVKTRYDSPKKVYKIFKTLIRELKLSNYVEIFDYKEHMSLIIP